MLYLEDRSFTQLVTRYPEKLSREVVSLTPEPNPGTESSVTPSCLGEPNSVEKLSLADLIVNVKLIPCVAGEGPG